jgi:GAF domain-containing protein
MVGFLLVAVLVPLLVNEVGDLAPLLARCLLRWGARRIGRADQAQRYEEEWLADLERVPGKLTKLVHACGVVARSVPHLRVQFRRRPRRELLSGVLPGHLIGAIDKQLAGSREIDAKLQHVAEVFVPHFAEHCFIDLFQGNALIRRVARHANDWTPPPGTWAQVGEQIRYPEGHFCQQAMARLDTIMVTDSEIEREHIPAPSVRSGAVSDAVGLTSVLTAPLYTRGELLGVMSVARSRLTSRAEERYNMADRDVIGAIASRVATAIENATSPDAARQTTLALQNPRRLMREALTRAEPAPSARA